MLKLPGESSTVYDDLLQQIRRDVGSGKLKPGVIIGSEHELCRQWGISRVSVRRATDLLVREGLIERRAGKGLYVRPADRSMSVVQVVVPNIAFDQCVQIARGAQTAGMDRGVQVQVYDAHSRLDWDLEMLKRLPETDMAGAIIVSWHDERFTRALFELKQKDYPFVVIDEQVQHLDAPSVVADNYSGGYTVGEQLLAAGHLRIGFIGNLTADTVQARMNGLRDAMNDHKVAFDRSLSADLATPLEGDWESAIRNATRELLKRSDPATAIFYSDDQTAIHAYGVIKAMRLNVPQDVSIVGFDDNPLCRYIDPPLTTVRQPSAEMGRVAMEMLMANIANKKRSAEHRVLPVEYVNRKSVEKRLVGPKSPHPVEDRSHFGRVVPVKRANRRAE